MKCFEMKSMSLRKKRIGVSVLTAMAVLWLGNYAQAQLPSLPPGNLNFIVLSDMGTTPDKQVAAAAVAENVARMVAGNRMDFIAVAGDAIHGNGVQSVDDPEWTTRFENLFSAPALHTLPWYAVAGNHEYKGSVPALAEYSHRSPRWNAPSRYFAFERSLGYGNPPCLFVFLDTTPLMDSYRKDPRRKGILEQSLEGQLNWLDSVLTTSRAGWKIVIGHHPVYAFTAKNVNERLDMEKRVGTLVEKHGADLYICGHIHSFQFIRPEGCKANYVVNPSAHTSRPVEPTDGTLACENAPGFTVYSVSKDTLDFYFVDDKGKVGYTTKIGK